MGEGGDVYYNLGDVALMNEWYCLSVLRRIDLTGKWGLLQQMWVFIVVLVPDMGVYLFRCSTLFIVICYIRGDDSRVEWGR